MKRKLSQFGSLFSLIAAFLTAIAPSSAASEKQLCTDKDFSLEIPPDWQAVPVAQSGLLCAFRSPTGFPTLNVLRLSGSYAEANLPLATQGKRLVESYREAGIGDPKLECIEEKDLNSKKLMVASFTYSNQNRQVASRLTVMSASNWHYLITEVDMTRSTPYSCSLETETLLSIRLNSQSVAVIPPSRDSFWILLAGIVGSALCLSGAVWYYVKRFAERSSL